METQLALPSGENATDTSLTVYGVIALGVATVVVLGALLGAWLAMRSGVDPWPPKGFDLQNYFGTTLSLTMLMSALAGFWAVYGVVKGERGQASTALALVVVLDVAFINLLTYVLRSAKLSPGQDAYGAVYYALNGAMIAVAATGVLVAGVTLSRVLGGQVTRRAPGLVWAAAWHATIVAVGWFVVYTATYVIN